MFGGRKRTYAMNYLSIGDIFSFKLGGREYKYLGFASGGKNAYSSLKNRKRYSVKTNPQVYLVR